MITVVDVPLLDSSDGSATQVYTLGRIHPILPPRSATFDVYATVQESLIAMAARPTVSERKEKVMSKIRDEFDPVSPNRALNHTILECGEALPYSEASTVLTAIKEHHAKGNVALADHTAREIVTGAYLVRDAHQEVAYNKLVGGKTPDWSLLREGNVGGIVECVKHNPSKENAAGQDAAMAAGEMWVGWIDDSVPRLLQKMERKALAYGSLVQSLGVPYVVSIFENFFAPAYKDEVEEAAATVFAAHDELSGILYVNDANGLYCFTYIKNPKAVTPIDLPSTTWNPKGKAVPAGAA